MKNINSPIFNRTKNHLNVHYEPSPKPLLLRRNPVNSSNVRWVPKLMKNSKHKVETVVLTSPYLAKIHSSLIERFGGPAGCSFKAEKILATRLTLFAHVLKKDYYATDQKVLEN